jgi:prepilin-type N-terminal cleavage/methylation domain-containing protein
MKNRFKPAKGFTLIELMTVVVIIGILLAISIPNFFSAQDRAKSAEVKTNMHLFQIITETYSVDWLGQFPPLPSDIKEEGVKKNYWKIFKNPYTKLIDEANSTIVNVSNTGEIEPSSFNKGNLAYISKDITSYTIYGADSKNGTSLMINNKVFSLTNH